MPKFAANLTMLFNDVPFLERFEQASQCGFGYVEYLFPYAWSPKILSDKLRENNLQQVLFNLPAGNWESGERGIACLDDRLDEFKRGVDIAIEYAQELNVNQINCLAGIQPKLKAPQNIWDTLVKNIEYATQQLDYHGITLLVEPINSRVDMPGFYIDTFNKAKQLVEAVDKKNLKIQFDIYHMQIMQGDILRTVQNNINTIGHIQFADCPGRHEPGTGELNFDNIFKSLDQIGYQGWVSAEYVPSRNTRSSLAWLRP